MRTQWLTAIAILIGAAAFACRQDSTSKDLVPPPNTIKTVDVESWVTKTDGSTLLQKNILKATVKKAGSTLPDVQIDASTTYQSIDGFGYTLTGGSAMLINKMAPAQKEELLKTLFGKGEADIGVSFLRLSMGSSDLDATVFSYNDLPTGQTDIDQSKFNLNGDKENLIPVLKAIFAINPDIKIISTPWSPPVWMKDNGNSKGGHLKEEYYASYATYFVKYIQAMQKEGIPIYAITPQNEPLHPGNNPSLEMLPQQQLNFVKNYLGPAFAANNITTKIIVYDHNLDRIDYPLTILNDNVAAKFIDGSAFHLYAGDISEMSKVHEAYPDKNLYFTEQWTSSEASFQGDFGWHLKNVIIGSMNNWAKAALEWNLANDPAFQPHTDGGCTQCKGAITIDGNNYQKNVSFYIIGQVAKFVPPGSKRIQSGSINGLSSVCFLRPDNKKVLLLLNENNSQVQFNIKVNGEWVTLTAEGNAATTLLFF